MSRYIKPFDVMEKLTEDGEFTSSGNSFMTYAEACDYVDALPKSRIPFCAVHEVKETKQKDRT
jgi:hypothetical protein